MGKFNKIKKMKFAFAALIATASTIMDDGETHVTKFPYVGATCQLQIGEVNLLMLGQDVAPAAPAKAAKKDIGSDLKGLEHCPDFIERHTLLNGTTRAVKYPTKGFNCNADYAL